MPERCPRGVAARRSPRVAAGRAPRRRTWCSRRRRSSPRAGTRGRVRRTRPPGRGTCRARRPPGSPSCRAPVAGSRHVRARAPSCRVWRACGRGSRRPAPVPITTTSKCSSASMPHSLVQCGTRASRSVSLAFRPSPAGAERVITRWRVMYLRVVASGGMIRTGKGLRCPRGQGGPRAGKRRARHQEGVKMSATQTLTAAAAQPTERDASTSCRGHRDVRDHGGPREGDDVPVVVPTGGNAGCSTARWSEWPSTTGRPTSSWIAQATSIVGAGEELDPDVFDRGWRGCPTWGATR